MLSALLNKTLPSLLHEDDPEDHTRRYVVRHTQDKNCSVHHTHTYDSNEQPIAETPPQPILTLRDAFEKQTFLWVVLTWTLMVKIFTHHSLTHRFLCSTCRATVRSLCYRMFTFSVEKRTSFLQTDTFWWSSYIIWNLEVWFSGNHKGASSHHSGGIRSACQMAGTWIFQTHS